MSEANQFRVSSCIICLHTRKTNYNEFVLWQLLVLSLLIKYVYCRYESNFPLAPESSSRTGISLIVKVFIPWVQIQTDISLSVDVWRSLLVEAQL